MAVQGIWFDGKTSASVQVELQIDHAGVVSVVQQEEQTLLAQLPLADIRITSRVGNTPRYLYFPDGQKCEVRNHAQIDEWLQQFHPSFWRGLAHKLESHIYFVAVTLVLMIGFTYGMLVYGLPAATRYVAFHTPPSVMDRAAKETMSLLDKTQLDDSKLDEQTQQRILAHFQSAIAQNPDLHIKVVFRHGNEIGANAFALPDGTVLFTDEIVQLAKNDDELLAVFAHEIGHVRYRHSLRAAIQGSVVSFGVAMLTGDLSAASNLLATLPVLITTMSYSRDFEREADDASLVYLNANHIAPHHFVDLMERLTYQGECRHWLKLERKKLRKKGIKTAEDAPDEDALFDAEANRAECDRVIAEHKNDFLHSKFVGYFASHPETKERVEKFK